MMLNRRGFIGGLVALVGACFPWVRKTKAGPMPASLPPELPGGAPLADFYRATCQACDHTWRFNPSHLLPLTCPACGEKWMQNRRWCNLCQRTIYFPQDSHGLPEIGHPCPACGQKWFGILPPSRVGPWAERGFGK